MDREPRFPIYVRFFVEFGKIINLILWWMLLLVAVRGFLYLSPELNHTRLADYLTFVVQPMTALLGDLFDQFEINPVIRGKNILLPVLFLVLLLFRRIGTWGLNEFQFILTRWYMREPAPLSGDPTAINTNDDVAEEVADRQIALKRYNEARAILDSTSLELTFLSLDVVDSTGLKRNQDRYVIEQTFSDYRKLVEEQLDHHNAYKATWTPDGQMAAFRTVQEAANCGQNILKKLEHFNENVSTIDDPFKVRMGMNAGEVSTDDTTPMVEISDFSVDLAGHLQKYARPNTIWTSEATYNKLDDNSGFKQTDEVVDENVVYEWSVSSD